MSQLIDWHAHLFPEELIAVLRGRNAEPYLTEAEGVTKLFGRPGGDAMKAGPGLFSVQNRLADLDRAGVDAQVLSIAGLMGIDSADDDGVDALVDAANAGLSRVVREHPTRFKALASLPLRDPVRAADVLEHAVSDLGLIGAILPVDAFVTLERGETFRPVLERAHKLGAHLFVHPGPLPSTRQLRPSADLLDRLRFSIPGIQNGITEAAITLEFTDLLDGLEGATVHVANLAGALAYYAGRWAHTQERFAVAPWDGRLRRIYVDTASLGAAAVQFAAGVFGADRLLFGTDAPVYGIDTPAAEARRLGLGFTPTLAAA